MVKNSSANQSIALITPRASVGRAKAASTAIGGSSRMNCTSPPLRCRNSSTTTGSSTASGIATWAARRMPAQATHAHAAIGQTGHVYRNRLRMLKPNVCMFGEP
ncbi:hypothetical protein D9M72_480850 [compost metagenome]